MARSLTESEWIDVRFAYENSAESIRSIARRFGCSHTAIQKRIDQDGWARDPTGEIERRTKLKIAGIVANKEEATKKATEPDEAQVAKLPANDNGEPSQLPMLPPGNLVERAIELESTRRAEIILLHRREWEEHRDFTKQAIDTLDRNAVAMAKVYADILATRQTNELRAWRVEVPKKVELSGPEGQPIRSEQIIRPDLSQFDEEDLLKMREVANNLSKRRAA